MKADAAMGGNGATGIGQVRVTRRRIAAGAAALAGVSAAATVAYAGAIEPQGLVVTRYTRRCRRGPQAANSRSPWSPICMPADPI